MTTAVRFTPGGTDDLRPPPRVKRWTKSEYNALVDQGVFSGQRLYLFRGELIEMAPMGSGHATGISKATKVLFSLFDPTHFDIRVQLPFDVPGESMPEPDLLVCTTHAATRQPHPAQAQIIIEVSDSSLAHDRDKAFEYAAAGVQEYWIVNLPGRCVEIYRDPGPDRTALLGHRYPPPTIAAAGDVIVARSASGKTVKVADLLP